MLEWLLQSGTKKGSPLEVDDNTLDWARGTLASLLVQPKDAPRADLERALRLLLSIKSDNKGFKFLQAPLEARLKTFSQTTGR